MDNSENVAQINFSQMSHPELMMCVTDRKPCTGISILITLLKCEQCESSWTMPGISQACHIYLLNEQINV